MAEVNYFRDKMKRLYDDPSSFAEDPAFKFQMDQGTQAVQRSQRGMRGSGNALAALAQYGQGLAHQTRGSELDRLGGLLGQEQQYDLGEDQNRIAREGIASGERMARDRLGVDRDRLGLDRDLGMGQLGLGRDRLGLDRDLGMGGLENQRRGQDLDFGLGMTRAGADYDLGRRGIDTQRRGQDYDFTLGSERNALTGYGMSNDFTLGQGRLGVDRYNARTQRGTARSNAAYTAGRNRREDMPFTDPWSRY